MRQGIPIIFILFLTLTSCDCQYHLSGVVLDKLTKKPIQDIAIGKTDTTDLDNPFNRKTMTRENGDYEIYGTAGRCNEITMFFTKDGYETRKITFQNNSTDTILLQPTPSQKNLGLLQLKITFYQKFLILKHMKQQEESMNKKESENQKRTLTLEERMKIRTYPSYFQDTLREIVENSTDSVEEAWEYLKDWESMM